MDILDDMGVSKLSAFFFFKWTTPLMYSMFLFIDFTQFDSIFSDPSLVIPFQGYQHANDLLLVACTGKRGNYIWIAHFTFKIPL